MFYVVCMFYATVYGVIINDDDDDDDDDIV